MYQIANNLDNSHHQQPSRSADNSPIIQPQQPQQHQPQIIPIISVSQLPINQSKPVSPDAFVNEDEILPMLEHDRFDILFRKLCIRLKLYFAKNVYEMAIHFMNYDHDQIIAALNNELVLHEMAQGTNNELDNYNKKSLAIRMENSIWNDELIEFVIDDCNFFEKNQLMKELNLFNQPFRKTTHLLNLITNNVRKFDHLRVKQIMNLIKKHNRNTLIGMCVNETFFKQTILTAQNVIHKHISKEGIRIANDIRQALNNNLNANENKENAENDNKDDEFKENDVKDEKDENENDISQAVSDGIDGNSQPSQIPIDLPVNFNKQWK